MKCELYTPAFDKAVKNYQLADTTYTGNPKQVLARCQTDAARFPVMILDEDRLLGFFCLHWLKSQEMYGFQGKNTVLLRGFSIDDRYQGKGIAASALTGLFDFIARTISPEITRGVLAVNAENIHAQKAYQKAGFQTLPRTFDGKIGKLVLMEKNKPKAL